MASYELVEDREPLSPEVRALWCVARHAMRTELRYLIAASPWVRVGRCDYVDVDGRGEPSDFIHEHLREEAEGGEPLVGRDETDGEEYLVTWMDLLNPPAEEPSPALVHERRECVKAAASAISAEVREHVNERPEGHTVLLAQFIRVRVKIGFLTGASPLARDFMAVEMWSKSLSPQEQQTVATETLPNGADPRALLAAARELECVENPRIGLAMQSPVTTPVPDPRPTAP